jgi:hypothetical protein
VVDVQECGWVMLSMCAEGPTYSGAHTHIYTKYTLLPKNGKADVMSTFGQFENVSTHIGGNREL